MSVPDHRKDLCGVEEQLLKLLRQLRPEQLGLPTPCGDWTVAQLGEHIVSLPWVFRAIGLGTAPDVPTIDTTQVTQLEFGYAGGLEQEWSVWTDDELLERSVDYPSGTMSGAAAVLGWLGETLVHGWDLAQAIGAEFKPDESACAAALAFAQENIPATPRNPQAFGPVVSTSPDATNMQQLAGWLGRAV